MPEILPQPRWRHPCCDATGVSNRLMHCSKCGKRGEYAGRNFHMHVLMGRFRETYGVMPTGPHRRLADALLFPLRTKCKACEGVGYVGDEYTCRRCRVCDGSGGHWTGTNQEIRAAYQHLLTIHPHATAGDPLPVYLIPDDALLTQPRRDPGVTPSVIRECLSRRRPRWDGTRYRWPHRLTEPVLSGEVQRRADRAIEALGRDAWLDDDPALERLQEMLDEGEWLNECVCDQERNWVHAPFIDRVVEHVQQVYEEGASKAARYAAIERAVGNALRGDMGYWGEEYRVPIVAPLRHSDGRQRAHLQLYLEDYLTPTYQWRGLYRSMNALLLSVAEQGRIVSMQDFRALSRKEVLGYWI